MFCEIMCVCVGDIRREFVLSGQNPEIIVLVKLIQICNVNIFCIIQINVFLRYLSYLFEFRDVNKEHIPLSSQL